MPPPCSAPWRVSGARRRHFSFPWPPGCAWPPCRPGAGRASRWCVPCPIGPRWSAPRASAEQVLSCVGEVVWVATEDALDVVTALSGSGPAYFFLLAELMAEAAARLGLEGAAARRLAAATLYGAGLLAHSADADLARLRAEVTSRGGTTEAALRVFEDAGLRATVARALEAAALRGHELAAAHPDLIQTAGDS